MARITVEDCLAHEQNRFALVLLASKRTKQLLQGAKALTDSRGNKPVVVSLREIAASKVRFMTPDEIREAEERGVSEELVPTIEAVPPRISQNGGSHPGIDRTDIDLESNDEL